MFTPSSTQPVITRLASRWVDKNTKTGGFTSYFMQKTRGTKKSREHAHAYLIGFPAVSDMACVGVAGEAVSGGKDRGRRL